MKQIPAYIGCDWLISNSRSKDGSRKIAAMHVTLKVTCNQGGSRQKEARGKKRFPRLSLGEKKPVITGYTERGYKGKRDALFHKTVLKEGKKCMDQSVSITLMAASHANAVRTKKPSVLLRVLTEDLRKFLQGNAQGKDAGYWWI